VILTLDPSSPKGPIGPSSPLEINQNKSWLQIVFKNRNLNVLHLFCNLKLVRGYKKKVLPQPPYSWNPVFSCFDILLIVPYLIQKEHVKLGYFLNWWMAYIRQEIRVEEIKVIKNL